MTDYAELARTIRERYETERPSAPIPIAELQPGYKVAHVVGPQGDLYIWVRAVVSVEVDRSRHEPVWRIHYDDGFTSTVPECKILVLTDSL